MAGNDPVTAQPLGQLFAQPGFPDPRSAGQHHGAATLRRLLHRGGHSVEHGRPGDLHAPVDRVPLVDGAEVDRQVEPGEQLCGGDPPVQAAGSLRRLDERERHVLRRPVPVRRPTSAELVGDPAQEGLLGRSRIADVERAGGHADVEDEHLAHPAERLVVDLGQRRAPRVGGVQRRRVEPHPCAAQPVQYRAGVCRRIRRDEHRRQIRVVRLQVAQHQPVGRVGVIT